MEDSGDSDKEERSREGSSADHTTSPLDFISTVPVTFSFEVGLILMIEPETEEVVAEESDPPDTLNLNKGDSEAKITTSNILSHLRRSPDCDDLPLNSNLNTSPSSPRSAEVLTLNATCGEVTEDTMVRDPSQLER